MTDTNTQSPARIVGRMLVPSAAALLLAGCISFGPKVPDQLITLTPQSTAPAGNIGGIAGRPPLIVLDPETDRDLDMLRVPVQVSSSSVAYLKDAVWLEKPARQFRTLVAETVRARNQSLVFEGLSADTAQQRVLAGRLVRMGYNAGDGSVLVRFDALLTEANGTFHAQRFEAKVPGIAAEAATVSPALNQAANEVAVQVADWISQTPVPAMPSRTTGAPAKPSAPTGS